VPLVPDELDLLEALRRRFDMKMFELHLPAENTSLVPLSVVWHVATGNPTARNVSRYVH
jgi:hypothetical protein